MVAENRETGELRTLYALALFVFIGTTPHTDWLSDQLALDDSGYVLAGSRAASTSGDDEMHVDRPPPAPLETTRAGVFVAGDVRSGSVKRVASAVGEGAIAVRFVHEYLAGADAGIQSLTKSRG